MAKQYKVSLWASVIIEANSEEEAEDIVGDMIMNYQIKAREYDFDIEEWEEEEKNSPNL